MIDYRLETFARHGESEATKYSDTLYHYTSLTALSGMLFGAKELWFGDAAKMNDTKELSDFLDRLKVACLDTVKPENRAKCEAFFAKVYEHLQVNYPYIMSFSRQADDVAQWERYADNAKGVCMYRT